jgi:hypothetical protein
VQDGRRFISGTSNYWSKCHRADLHSDEIMIAFPWNVIQDLQDSQAGEKLDKRGT